MGKSADRLIKAINTEISAGRVRKIDIIRATGFSASQLDAYLNSNSVPGLDAADKLASALGTTLADVLSGMGAPRISPAIAAIVRQLESLDNPKAVAEIAKAVAIMISMTSGELDSGVTTGKKKP
jgi:transcriptional regulator with XRE-family HTH domain